MAIFIFLCPLGFSVSFCGSIESYGETPVKLKADNLRFDQETGIVLATGSVEAGFEDIDLKADSITLDTNSSMATAEGDVSLKRASYEASGSSMTFNFKNDEASIKDFYSEITNGQVKGTIFLSAKEVFDKRDEKIGLNGSSTTCDQKDDPHYFVLAKKFLYFPDDKVVATNATVYLHNVPVMWLPFYVYDLKKRRVALLMPSIGTNDVEGNFIKSEIQYFIDNGASGSVYLDLMSKKGIGYGVDHDYVLNKKNSGTAYLYHVYESDTGIPDWVAKLKHELKIDDTKKLSVEYNYSNIYLVPSGRLDQTDTKVNYSYSGSNEGFYSGIDAFSNRQSTMYDRSFTIGGSFSRAKTNYAYNSRGGLGSPAWENISQSLTHTQKVINDNWTFTGLANYYRSVTSEGYPFKDRLEPTVGLAYSDPILDFKISESAYINPTEAKFIGNNNDEYVEKMPEVSASIKSIRVVSFEVIPEMGYGRYHEAKYISLWNSIRSFTANRYKTALTVRRTFAVPLGSSLSLSGAMEQYNYDTGDERYMQKENISLTTDLGGFYRNTASADRGMSEGNSPFFFDNTGTYYNNLRDTMVFYKGDKLRFTIDGGYNYVTSKYFDLLLNLDAKPSDTLHINVGSGYDIEDRNWRDLVTLVTIAPFLGLKADISHTYDMNIGKTKNASDLIDWEIGDSWQSRWHFKIGQTYDYLKEMLIFQEVSIIKDLHCWDASFSWSDFRKEFKVTFTLKAFPDRPIGFATGSQGFMLEGMNEMGSSKSPVRY